VNKTELASKILEILELEENLLVRLDQIDVTNIIDNAKILCKKEIVITGTVLRGINR
jgi:hypothetical protein